jgi:hypothetical protein
MPKIAAAKCSRHSLFPEPCFNNDYDVNRHGERDHWYDVLWSCGMDALRRISDERDDVSARQI